MDAASLEQMNKLRKSLGLPLLSAPNANEPSTKGPTFKEHESGSSEDEEPASTLESREAAGYDNWKELQDAAAAKKRREAKIAALKKARDASQKFSKLAGKGLGDVTEEGDLDAKAWLKSQHKRMKKIEAERAERMAKELEEREMLATIQYKSSDLAGVHVAHEIEDFGEDEGEQILTLKDKEIGDEDEDDELEARELVAREGLQKRLESKRNKPAYDVHAQDDSGERKILAQYDDDTDRKRKFTLDALGSSLEARESKRHAFGDLLKPITLDILKEEPISDYLTEVKIKKPKKPKKKRERAGDEDFFPATDEQTDTVMDGSGLKELPRTQPKNEDDSFQDDEDLQRALAQSRRAAFKKKIRVRSEDIIKELREEEQSISEDAEAEAGGLVIDETSAFVENLQVTRPEARTPHPIQKAAEHPENAGSPAEDEEDVRMDNSSYQDDIRHEDTTQPNLEHSEGADRTATGLEEESVLEQGLGATLNLLKQRGLVKSSETDINSIQRQRDFFLQEKMRREAASEQIARAQREQDRKAGTYDRMSTKDRQDYARFENSRREQQDQRAMAEFFNANYRPNVELKYVDELGRSLDPREAFKHLSHQFHGKGSGKQKTEKRLKKIEDEKKREAMSTLDSSQAIGMNNAQGTTAKKNKQAGVRLA